MIFNLYIIYQSIHKQIEVKISEEEIAQTKINWPKYTVLCPLYHEWKIVPQFINAMKGIDYPKNKLQVILLLEEDDKETIQYVNSYRLPKYFTVSIVPHSLPKTKPKACNYGLKDTNGEYLVIYDAEDIPDPLQLKKAVIAFNKLDKKVVCLQAKLNFYNPHQNILTKLFAAEYSLWFDIILGGLSLIKAPIPLGGTSNHIKTESIKQISGWDAFNVTEDCDLGIRLHKHGYQTAILDSQTYEEANSKLQNWLNQRSRWVKGYIQTLLVHSRKFKTKPKVKSENTHLFYLVIGFKVFFLFCNPILWFITAIYFLCKPLVGNMIESFYPNYILYPSVICLVAGNFLYFYYFIFGCFKRKYYSLIKYMFLVPFYWLAMSVAAWKALIQLIVQPHYWAKTLHGLHLDQRSFDYKTLIDLPIT